MQLQIIPIENIPEVKPGDDLAELILKALKPEQQPQNTSLQDEDVLLITQKIVSKAEGRLIEVGDKNNPQARIQIAEKEAVQILRRRGDLIISETSHGFVCANSGVDFSNLEEGYGALLPKDPDKSARKILGSLTAATEHSLAVIITDTFGRPWRRGLTNVAIGSAGIKPIIDLRGQADSHGRELQATEIALVDELAGASEIVMGKSLGIPAAIARGLTREWFGEGSVKENLIRPASEDFFR